MFDIKCFIKRVAIESSARNQIKIQELTRELETATYVLTQ